MHALEEEMKHQDQKGFTSTTIVHDAWYFDAASSSDRPRPSLREFLGKFRGRYGSVRGNARGVVRDERAAEYNDLEPAS